MDDVTPALTMIRRFEGCVLTAYKDPVGVVTIGFGTTGPGIHMGLVITEEQAESYLEDTVDKLSSQIHSMVQVKITNNQLCALIDFSYNLGIRALYHSTLLSELNRGARDIVVSEQFLRWTHAGGTVLEGLVLRRQAEAKLFLT